MASISFRHKSKTWRWLKGPPRPASSTVLSNFISKPRTRHAPATLVALVSCFLALSLESRLPGTLLPHPHTAHSIPGPCSDAPFQGGHPSPHPPLFPPLLYPSPQKLSHIETLCVLLSFLLTDFLCSPSAVSLESQLQCVVVIPAQVMYKHLINSWDDEQTKEENGEGTFSRREPRVIQGETHSPGGLS